MKLLRLWIVFALLYGPVASAQGPATPRGPHLTPLPAGPAATRVASPAEQERAAQARTRWQALSPKEQEQVLEVFRKLVGPELRRAYLAEMAASGGRARAPHPGFSADNMAREDGEWNQPPEVSASASPSSGVAPLAVELSAFGWDPDGWITSYYWDLGDGNAAYDAWVSHTYASPGTYYPTVYVTDDWGHLASATAVVNVSGGGGNQPPSVGASVSPASGPAPLAVTLSGTAFDPDGFVVSYSWSFGDGGGAVGAVAAHTYASPGTYQATLTVTDNIGATASASATVSVTQPGSSGPDNDGDGLADSFEGQLADQFTPAYWISFYEYPGVGMALFQDRPDAMVPTQSFPTSFPPTPTSYYRVTPLGVVGGQSYVQLDYFTLWNHDTGLALSGACAANIDFLDFFGIWSPAFGSGLLGHELDHERSALRVVAPAVGGGVNPDPTAYRADRAFLAAHEDTPTDRSSFITINPPAGPEVHYWMFLSLSKHGTYPFVPHGISLLPGWAVGALFGGVSTACWFTSPELCDLLWFIAYEVVFDCVTEKHAPYYPELAPANLRINLGELGRPLPGGSFSAVPAMTEKLNKYFAIP